MKLLLKTRWDYFNNIDIKSVSYTKKFWKTSKSFFSNKGLNSNKILLSEKGRLIKDHVAISTAMNDYFVNITQTIGLKQFQFEKEVRREMMNLNSKKATCYGSIPDSYLPIITKIINESIIEGTFASELKLAEVTPVFKNLNCVNKENYRPVSLLSHIPKVFERILYNQLLDFMKDYLSNILTGFQKGHGAQHSLIIIIEKRERTLECVEK